MPEITVDLSWQSIHLLKELERWGIYGFDVSDIAGRFIDKALVDLAERRHLKLVKKPEDQNGPGEVEIVSGRTGGDIAQTRSRDNGRSAAVRSGG